MVDMKTTLRCGGNPNLPANKPREVPVRPRLEPRNARHALAPFDTPLTLTRSFISLTRLDIVASSPRFFVLTLHLDALLS